MRNFIILAVIGLQFAVASAQADSSVAETPDAVRIENARLLLTLSKAAKGSITSLTDKATGIEFVAAGAPLFLLDFSTKGQPGAQNPRLSSADAAHLRVRAENHGKTRVAVLEYDDLRQTGVSVVCTATVSEADPLVRWRLSATFPQTLTLEAAHFPLCVLKAPIEGDAAADALVLGSTKGGVIRRPADMKTGVSVSAAQPGSMAAQFGCYYDGRAGLYVAAYDSAGYPKSLSFLRTSEGIEPIWTQNCFAPSPFSLDYDVVMTTFAGADPQTPTDWRDAADIYKRWALAQPWCVRTYAQRTDIPMWMKAGPAMVRFGREWLGEPQTIEQWIDGYWRKSFPDAPLITAYWGWEKVATWVAPDYFPVYPSDKAFTDLVAWSRQRGCHAFLWPSGYHWTLTFGKRPDGSFAWDDRDRFNRIAAPHAVHTRDGKVWQVSPFWLDGGALACMCPGDPWTIDWWNREIAAPLARRGAEIIQFDQVVGGSFQWCYSADHGHPPGPGLWMTQAFERQLRTTRAECRKTQPDAVVCFEEPNERFIHLVGIQDYRDRESPYEWASVFNYLYHEFLPTFQSNPEPGDTVMAAYCFANGQMPHLMPSMDTGPGPALANGGFEDHVGQALRGWAQVNGYQGKMWTGTWARDEGEKHGGAASLRLDNATDGDIVQVSQNVPVGGGFAVGHTYRLSAWMKTDHVNPGNAINAATFTSDWKPTAGCRLPYPPAGAGWTKVSGDFTVGEGSVLLRIMIHVEGKARVWVDDMTLEEVLPGGKLTTTMRAETPPDHKLVRRWVELYRGEGRPYLLFGRMLHPPRLTVRTIAYKGRQVPAIMHNAYQAPDDSEACILVNATDSPQAGELRWKDRTIAVSLQAGEAELVR